jgi:ssDNA-specific exonuclease RecJ
LNNKRVRPIRPWEKGDKLLLQTANNGDYVLTGFRNRDLFAVFYPPSKKITEVEIKRKKARITGQIRILRGHGIVKKVAHTHRYLVTSRG